VHLEGQLLSLKNVARVRVLDRIVEREHVSDQPRLCDVPRVRPDRSGKRLVSIGELELEHQRHHIQRGSFALQQEAAQQADHYGERPALRDRIRAPGVVEGRRVRVLASPAFGMIVVAFPTVLQQRENLVDPAVLLDVFDHHRTVSDQTNAPEHRSRAVGDGHQRVEARGIVDRHDEPESCPNQPF
jgi:hypothetical protein